MGYNQLHMGDQNAWMNHFERMCKGDMNNSNAFFRLKGVKGEEKKSELAPVNLVSDAAASLEQAKAQLSDDERQYENDPVEKSKRPSPAKS